MEHILGRPLYKEGDTVKFTLAVDGAPRQYVGTVEIVDAWGTWEQNKQPSYDILVKNWRGDQSCLIKHIPESWVEEEE